MTATLVDAHVLIDLSEPDGPWFDWSATALQVAGGLGPLVINPVIYAEVSIAFLSQDDLDAVLPETLFRREDLLWSAAFLAGKAFHAYRLRGSARTAPLPDFYIGAHAATAGYRLLTRDRGRYATYFPTVTLIAPETGPEGV